VLIPGWIGRSLFDFFSNSADLPIWTAELQRLQLNETLSTGGPFTVFLPTNSGPDRPLDRVPSAIDYHIIEGMLPSSSFSDGLQLNTLLGENINLTVSEFGASIGGNFITNPDQILCNNGIVHFINGELTPPTLPPTMPPMESSASHAGVVATLLSLISASTFLAL
jgi:transforming growth factor-beta-induced protein